MRVVYATVIEVLRLVGSFTPFVVLVWVLSELRQPAMIQCKAH